MVTLSVRECLGQVSNIEVTSPSTATITCMPKCGYFSIDHVRLYIEKTFIELGESVDIEGKDESILHISAPDPACKVRNISKTWSVKSRNWLITSDYSLPRRLA